MQADGWNDKCTTRFFVPSWSFGLLRLVGDLADVFDVFLGEGVSGGGMGVAGECVSSAEFGGVEDRSILVDIAVG